jgi:cyclic lactone autoinducer peptide
MNIYKRRQLMKIATDRRKNIISHVKGTLDTMLRVEANSASCGVMYEPESPKELSKFKRKTK